MEYSGAGGKLIHEKNQKQKISWHCPFKGNPPSVQELPEETKDIKSKNIGSTEGLWMSEDIAVSLEELAITEIF